VLAHVGNPEEGGSHSCTLVHNLDQFLLERLEPSVIFLRILAVSRPQLFFENLRFDRFVQSLILE
jgi:hypothetical protein